MFESCTIFNGDVSSWTVSRVVNFGVMFNDARAFNADISAWYAARNIM